MRVLAKTQRGFECLFSRKNAVAIPKSWSKKKVDAVIEGLNKYFKLPENVTFYEIEIDRYSGIYPEYKATMRNGNFRIERI